jgi:polysaccharide deacetylase 2 family uncharacterized protein YibQ
MDGCMTDCRPKVLYRYIPVYLFVALMLCRGPAIALEPAPEHHSGAVASLPMIAVIIDDLGNQRLPGLRTIALDGPIACAIMPFTAHSTYLAEHAFAAGKEVILHLPMQPVEMERIAGPGEISLDTDKAELAYILDQNLGSVPHSVGISNHMGSLITRHPGHMRWLMQELASRGDLFFIDSFTTPDSVAYEIAIETGIPAARRHIFLDNEQTPAAIDKQFARLKRQARKNGFAIGIGHPYPATLDYLQTALPDLEKQGIRLVPVAQVIALLDSMNVTAKLAIELAGNPNILVRAK